MTYKSRKTYGGRFAAVCLFSAVLAACGGGGSSSDDDDDSDDTSTAELKTGVFIDSAVSGVTFTTSTQSGTTNANGEFQYREGESVTFSIGDLLFPATTATAVVTPVSIAGAANINDQQATNIARLLQSLDDDGNLANGISIPAAAAASAAAIDFDVDTATFEADTSLINLLAGVSKVLVSETDARNHVTSVLDALASDVVGLWIPPDGPDEDSTLILLENGNFVYLELDEVAPNGAEFGTYTYDATTGTFTFQVIFDTNGPGEDSGIGDTGSNTVQAAIIDDELIIEGGEVTFEREVIDETGTTGVWETDNTLLAIFDGEFIYVEHGGEAPNGWEDGEGVIDSGTSLTFVLESDNIGPGEDAGIGDTGVNNVFNYTLSGDQNTLTFTDENIVFTRSSL